MMKSPRVFGYLYLFLGSLFLFFAIQSAQQTSLTDIFTIALMAFAAIDYLIAFRYFGKAAKQQQENNDK